MSDGTFRELQRRMRRLRRMIAEPRSASRHRRPMKGRTSSIGTGVDAGTDDAIVRSRYLTEIGAIVAEWAEGGCDADQVHHHRRDADRAVDAHFRAAAAVLTELQMAATPNDTLRLLDLLASTVGITPHILRRRAVARLAVGEL